MATLECVITSPEELAFEGRARSVVVPAIDGSLGILPRHAPLVGALGSGELRMDLEDGTTARYMVVGGGFVEVVRGRVTILAATLEDLSTLDRSDAEAKLAEVIARKPQTKDIDELEAYGEDVRVAKRRVQLVK